MQDKLLLTIIDKFSASTIAELDLNDGTTRLVLRREGAFQGTAATAMPSMAPVVPVMGPTVPAAVPTAGAAESAVHLGLPVSAPAGEKIESPIVATFYTSPGPDTPPFVSTGSKVKAGDTLCILEAMKMMNRLEAEFDCEILGVLVGNGELVEYGQALFEVKRL